MFGSHLSIAGGMHNALLRAEELSHDTTQVFTKNQQQWACKPLGAAEIDPWAMHVKRLKFKKMTSHASYLINLAATNDEIWRKGISLFTEELRRCQLLGIPYCVIHPGAHLGTGEEAGIAKIATALDEVHSRIPEAKHVTTCLEITAGQGTCLGCKLEHLADIISLVKEPKRVGVCLDTAHLFAAGYDFRGRKFVRFRKEISKTIGLKRVKVWHLNDSKKPLGSRVDRHEHIGRGTIGESGFAPIVRDEAFENIPKIMETPKGTAEDGRDWDAINLETLKKLI